MKDCCIGYGKIIDCILTVKIEDRNYHGIIIYTQHTKEFEYNKTLFLSLSTIWLLIILGCRY